ncbi:hypothetical protein [Aureivirga sp. CE67]|uniref:hypothetical protein n=1 Tax=Aureivirga sp. CE67 TaxID=1788983 RepID=UPI0018C9A649|nr:hypothetical protein [Aureivirga sp. CE67]
MRKTLFYFLLLNSIFIFAQDFETLPEVKLEVPKKTRKLVVGKEKKSLIGLMKANYKGKNRNFFGYRSFLYDSIYQSTPFIEEVKILTRSDVKDAKFEVYLHRIKQDGGLGEVLHEKPFIGVAKKRKKRTTISLNETPILFPKEGVYVVVKWIYSEENKYKMLNSKLIAPDIFLLEKNEKGRSEINAFLILTN